MLEPVSIESPPNTAKVHNPANGELIGRVETATTDDVEHALQLAVSGRAIAAAMPRHQRASILENAAHAVSERSEHFAQAIVAESGKTIRQALKEVDRCVNTLTLSAEEAKRIAGNEIPFDSYPGLEDRFGYFTKEPAGIVLAITPFNDPLNLVAHKVGPAIAAGCACLLKPALETPYSALALVECLHEAGLPRACLQVLLGDATVGDQLVRDNRVAMVSFTGGVRTGEIITRAAGLKRTTMDLGGNAPVFVLSDANIDDAATECASGAFWAAGQNCIGVQRIFCQEDVFDRFKHAVLAKTDALRLGDPFDPSTDVGPMVSESAALRIEEWVNEAIASGATCLTGNKRVGSYFSPTILTDVPSDAKVLCKEVFAPVVCLVPFSNLDDALAEANKPDFLLHGAVFTNSLNNAQKVCSALQCSGVMVNDSSDFRFDGMPFGGSKRGSLGREGVKYAIEEMTQSKIVSFKM
ncbi:MAG: aldehyde dehydrogenase family protein [Cognatishimia activa]